MRSVDWILLLPLAHLLPFDQALIYSNYVSIHQHTFPHAKVSTLLPQSWILKSIQPYSSHNYIKEVIYVPSTLNLVMENLSMVEDDHFCSLLCDQGFIVHIVHFHYCSSMNDILVDIIKWRLKFSRISPKNIAIIAHELSVPKVLHFLTDIVHSSQEVDLGAIILIDPPPLNSLITPQGRLHVLDRYFEPYYSFERFRSLCSTDICQDASLLIRWERFRRHLNAEESIKRMLIDSEDQYKGVIMRSLEPVENYDGEDYSVLHANTPIVIASQLLGKCPVRVSDVAKAFKDRILVINSFQPPENDVPDMDGTIEADEDDIWRVIGNSFGMEDWGYECAESVAEMYQAGPVIHLDSCLYGGEGSNDMGRESYEARVRSWHEEIADTMSDWLRLLHQMRYI